MEKNKLYITGVIQKVLPVLSTVTAYLVVDRVLRIPTEQYGGRYGGHPGFNDVKVNFLGIFSYFTFRICF